MALIRLKLIQELGLHARTQQMLAESVSYGWDPDEGELCSPVTYTGLIKSYYQGSNLVKQLTEFHQVCVDFAAGEIQKYIDKYEEYTDDDSPPFDPFDELTYYFDGGMIEGATSTHSLPPRIEQYAELMTTLRAYTLVKAAEREGFKAIFGDKVQYHYLAEDEDGETVAIPESQMPADTLNEIHANRDIHEIEIGYALDSYNEFYQKARKVIADWSTSTQPDVVACAVELLTFFK